jgi:hypothetical protein
MMQPTVQSFIDQRIGSLQIDPAPSLLSLDEWKKATRAGALGLLRLPKTSNVDKALRDYNAHSETFNASVRQWNATGSRDYLQRLTGSVDSREFQRGTDPGRDALDAQLHEVRRAYEDLQKVVAKIERPENVWLQAFKRTIGNETARQIQSTATSVEQGRWAMQTAASESLDLLLGSPGRTSPLERTEDGNQRSRFSADSVDVAIRNLAALRGRQSPDQDQAAPSGVLGFEAAGRQDGRVYSFSVDGGDSRRSSIAGPSAASSAGGSGTTQRTNSDMSWSNYWPSNDPAVVDRDNRPASAEPDSRLRRRSDHPRSDAALPAEPRTRSGEHRSAQRASADSPRSSLDQGRKPQGRFRG